MISRNELLDLLHDRLHQHLPEDQIERLTRDILALEGVWEEMDISHKDLGYSHSDLCSSICWLADQAEHGSVVKMLRKKK